MINHRSSSTSKRSRKASQAGYTIVEVAMASFVMIIGIASSLVTLKYGFNQVDLARGSTIASQILQSEVERLRLNNWATIDTLPATETFDGVTNFSTTSAALVGKYSVTRNVASDSLRPTEVKNITLSVTWKTADGISHTRSLSSIYAKNGLYDYYYTISHH